MRTLISVVGFSMLVACTHSQAHGSPQAVAKPAPEPAATDDAQGRNDVAERARRVERSGPARTDEWTTHASGLLTSWSAQRPGPLEKDHVRLDEPECYALGCLQHAHAQTVETLDAFTLAFFEHEIVSAFAATVARSAPIVRTSGSVSALWVLERSDEE